MVHSKSWHKFGSFLLTSSLSCLTLQGPCSLLCSNMSSIPVNVSFPCRIHWNVVWINHADTKYMTLQYISWWWTALGHICQWRHLVNSISTVSVLVNIMYLYNNVCGGRSFLKGSMCSLFLVQKPILMGNWLVDSVVKHVYIHKNPKSTSKVNFCTYNSEIWSIIQQLLPLTLSLQHAKREADFDKEMEEPGAGHAQHRLIATWHYSNHCYGNYIWCGRYTMWHIW